MNLLYIYMVDPGVMSASKITTYKGCPLSYFFNYVEHLKVPQSPAKVFGSEIHVMLKKFYRSRGNKQYKKSPFAFKSLESFLGAWNYRWWFGVVKNGFGRYSEIAWVHEKQAGSFFRVGQEILSSFYKHNINLDVPIDTEKRFDVEFEGYKLRGVYDRIDFRDGKYYIIDYKTDKNSPQENSFVLHRHPQFTIYSLAYEKNHKEELNEEKPIIAFLHLRTGKAFETKRSYEDYNYLKRLLESTVSGIKSNEFTPFYGFHCNFCEYIPICKKVCIDVGAKLKKLELIKDVEAKKIDWLSYDYLIPRQEPQMENIMSRLPQYLQKYLNEKFEYFYDLEEKIKYGDKSALKIKKEREEGLKFKNFDNIEE